MQSLPTPMYNHIKLDSKAYGLLKKYCKKTGMTLQAAATFAVIEYLNGNR